MTTTHILETAGVDIAYDVRGPLPTADGRPPLFMIAQPMDAGGFGALASHFPDRTVVTYDPRGLGRSTRKDGRVDHSPTVQADDVHAVIEAVGARPVEMFASSGGAVTALALVAAHPGDVVTLVAHEPPLIPVLPDAAQAERARAGFRDVYQAKGSGAGMAAFIAMTSWRGEFTDDYNARPAPDPAAFGMAAEDDGSRDDPLLSDRSWAVSSYRPDVDALAAAPTRIVIAVGEESMGTFTGRSAVATAELLGQQATVFPSHHGGFLGGEFGYAGRPEAFARKLREVLDHDAGPRQADATIPTVNAASATMDGESLWPRLAGLPLVIEACEYERLHAALAFEFERITTHVRLVGAGADGLGEDVSVFREDGTTLHESRPSLPLEGEWTLGAFCEHLATLELWREPPEWDVALRLRNWAFESAALDLALRQAGRSLHDVLGLEPQPVRFVNSLGLGEEPGIEPLRRRLARSPGVRFKLDAQATWAPALVAEVAATGAVDTIDFKGQYGFEVDDPKALGALYDHVIAAFPDAYLEDPHDLPEVAQRLGDHLERVSYDAPIRSAEDIGATPLAGRVVNVKPSRIGSLRALCEVYARCARERRPMYGGGMGELGAGRGQIELLAALFHADAPNDVAPSAYNEDDPAGDLPASPLAPRPDATGFRWAA